MNTIKFKLVGLHCEACIKVASLKIKKIEGIKDVLINLATGQAEITAERPVEIKEFEQALAGTDYTIKL